MGQAQKSQNYFPLKWIHNKNETKKKKNTQNGQNQIAATLLNLRGLEDKKRFQVATVKKQKNKTK